MSGRFPGWRPATISIILPWESNGQRNMADYSPRGRTESDMTENAHTRRSISKQKLLGRLYGSFFFFFVSFPSSMETSFQNGSSLVWLKQQRKYMDQNHNHLKVSSNRITENTQSLCNTSKKENLVIFKTLKFGSHFNHTITQQKLIINL